MRHTFTCLLILAIPAASVRAGDAVVPRKDFKESVTYPFIFKAEGYLAGKGAVPLRFTVAGPRCEQRQPPAAPLPARKDPVPEIPASETKAGPETPALPEANTNVSVESSSRRERPDFSKVPDEVLDFFKNTEGRPVRRAYLFDPIFQPVTPDDLPKSKATSVQK